MASSSSSSQFLPVPSSSSSSSSQSWNYDVFLSFRGEDTRKTFVDHLYAALVQQGIYTYKDVETLDRGNAIGPSLLKAIEESQIAVVIFSKNYANSWWCLDELAYIMKCKDTRGQIVMPIFYGVEPSEVRKQKGKYGEAFARHELENNNKVESWKRALEDVSSLSGWEPKNIANGHEAKCIREIVDSISRRLRPIISCADVNLVGIEARMQDLILKLKIGLVGVLMVGIWGVGGCGKTTLASSVYDEICGGFDSCCFIENIREESSKKGLKKLIEKIISLGVGRVGEGRNKIKSRLCRRKVLIVLDDVDGLNQLEALVGSHDWFGKGSRIIITTRDEHLLNAHKVDVIHNASLLNDDESIKLFHKHAHRNRHRVEGYHMLSKYVVSYANGLPLALKVLGSYLCDKSMNEWKSALARLKEIPHDDILRKLKISFDGLQRDEKQLFLDIACFFRGESEYEAMQSLDACGFHSVICIKVLIEKALINVIGGKFDMHDLVQDMGHYIVRGEHPKNPEKHTRVWHEEDVLRIFSMDESTELDKIEAIRVSGLPLHRRHVVANMKKLRWIDWKCYSASALPTNFPREDLCCLILSYCNQRQLWEGYKYLPNLRVMKLNSLDNLVKTPDFDGLPNLERFMVHACLDLKEIHPSIGRLERLVFLIIETCDNLKLVPPKEAQKLEIFDVYMDKKRKNVACYKQYCTHFFVTCLTSCCSDLRGDTEEDRIDLEEEPFSLPDHTPIGLQFYNRALRELCLKNCNLGDADINKFWELYNLKDLDIQGNSFSRLNFGLWQLPRLKRLDVSWCRDLVELSGLPSSIAVLTADYCFSLEAVGDISKCKWLWNVSFYGVNELGPLCGDTILNSMLEGNAIEDHFISFIISEYQILKGIVDMWVTENTFTLQLPHNWDIDFSGFLICSPYYQCVTIIIKGELDDKGGQFSVRQEPIEALDSDISSVTYVGYVSFNSLMRHTPWLNSAYNTITFSLESEELSTFTNETRFAARLIPRKTECDPVHTTKGATDSSEFYYGERENGKIITIQHQSKSSIKILWNPPSN